MVHLIHWEVDIMKKATKKAKKISEVKDVKLAQANDKSTESVETSKPEVNLAEVKQLANNASPVQRGIHFNKLAGVKDKHQVIAVFGKSGYSAYSWDKRAEILGITTEDLCARFKESPEEVKATWTAKTAKQTIETK